MRFVVEVRRLTGAVYAWTETETTNVRRVAEALRLELAEQWGTEQVRVVEVSP